MASNDTPKTIELHGHGVPHEAVADGAITPGHFINWTGANSVGVGGGSAAHVAREYDLTGKGIDDAYADGDQVLFTTYMAGSSTYSLVAAGAAAIAAGDLLAVQNDGTVAKAASGAFALAQAREAIDNSAGGSAVRIKVEITTGLTA